MGKKQITEAVRWQIVGLSTDKSKSKRQIAQLIGVSEKCVRTTLTNFHKNGTVKEKPRPGRPLITTERDRSFISRTFKSNKSLALRKGAAQFTKTTGKRISYGTIRNILKDQELCSSLAVRKPSLTYLDRKARLKWCKERADWSVERWKLVIFSDESNYEVLNRKNRLRFWRKKSLKYSPGFTQGVIQGGGGSVGIWGCITGQGAGVEHIYDERMNQYTYRDVLDNNLIPSIDLFFKDRDFYFVQDNAPCHTAKSIGEYFTENDINKLPWPARSPDLNPIENLWAWIDLQLTDTELRTKDDLRAALHDIWLTIPSELCNRLIESMPRRIKACIKARGGHIKY